MGYGPYTPIYKVDDTYFVSGQVGINPETKDVGDDIDSQTRQTLQNLKNILKSKNLDMDKVVKTTIFLVDMSDYKAINEIYERFFNDPKPARSCIAVKELPRVADKELLIEIEAIAVSRNPEANQ